MAWRAGPRREGRGQRGYPVHGELAPVSLAAGLFATFSYNPQALAKGKDPHQGTRIWERESVRRERKRAEGREEAHACLPLRSNEKEENKMAFSEKKTQQKRQKPYHVGVPEWSAKVPTSVNGAYFP